MATFKRCTLNLIRSIQQIKRFPVQSVSNVRYGYRTFATVSFKQNSSKGGARKAGSTVAIGTSLALFGLGKKEEKLSEKDQIRKIVSSGIVAKQNGDLKGASAAFHDALKQSSVFLKEGKITEKDDMNHRVFIYDAIANMTMEAGQFEAAEAVFKDTMKLALQLGMAQNDNAIIDMSLKLASIYQYTGREKLALEGLTFCIKEQEGKLNKAKEKKEGDRVEDPVKEKELENNTWILLGMAYKNFAYYYMHKGDYQKAEQLLVKSIDISKSILGESHDTTFVIMNDLATCCLLMKNYEKAEQVLDEGIQKSRKAKSMMEPAFSSNMGALYIRTNNLEKAEKYCSAGLKLAEKLEDKFLQAPNRACLAKVEELKELREEQKK